MAFAVCSPALIPPPPHQAQPPAFLSADEACSAGSGEPGPGSAPSPPSSQQRHGGRPSEAEHTLFSEHLRQAALWPLRLQETISYSSSLPLCLLPSLEPRGLERCSSSQQCPAHLCGPCVWCADIGLDSDEPKPKASFTPELPQTFDFYPDSGSFTHSMGSRLAQQMMTTIMTTVSTVTIIAHSRLAPTLCREWF